MYKALNILNVVQIVIRMFYAHTNFPVYIHSRLELYRRYNLTLTSPSPHLLLVSTPNSTQPEGPNLALDDPST
jgi:hypothetical protein